jgi:hypothetical protein
MAKGIPSVGDLRRKSEVTDDEIDVAGAVYAHQPSKAAVHDKDRTAKLKWTMVRTAVLLAHPVKG